MPLRRAFSEEKIEEEEGEEAAERQFDIEVVVTVTRSNYRLDSGQKKEKEEKKRQKEDCVSLLHEFVLLGHH